MRISTLPSPGAASSALLGLLASAELIYALPQPKVPARMQWAHNRGKKIARNALRQSLEGRSYSNVSVACSTSQAASITAPSDNVWAGLTDIEAVSVVSWLFGQSSLNLTATENATEWDNTILLVELQIPNKTDVVAHIDGGGPSPTRYAHVVLDHRSTEEPYYQDLLVGPLPLNDATAGYQPLEYPYTRKTAGKVRNLDADADTLSTEWLYKVGASVADITLDLWNGTGMGLDNDTLDIWGIDPLWQDDGRIIRWDMFWQLPSNFFDAETLMPLGLYFKSDVTGRDPSQWKLEGWLYDNVFYETTEAFRTAYWSGAVPKLAANTEGSWTETDPQDANMPYDSNYPPKTIAPSGSRFGVDYERKYVEWMEFSFYIGFSRDVGVTLYDIKYQGQRILYELGLQEALAHYAGGDPVQSGTSYLDTFYGFGPYAFELIPGYDCPEYATYFNSTFYVDETTHTHLNSICLFEFSADYPIQRHSTSDYVSGTKNTFFSVRSVSTVGNYDYMFTYSFYLDGSITAEVRASGYIQSAYYTTGSDFGFKIQEALSGSMHDHVLNFKADFDILGTANSIQRVKNVPVSRVFPWSNGKARNTMQLERSFVASEDESRFNWAPNIAEQVLVVNKDETNKWGEYRAYRVLPMSGAMHLTVKNSSNLVNAAHWAEYDIQVTRQHDHEPRAAHSYNSQDVHDPPINFDTFFDGESLNQEDLVMWLNLGMHHVPHTGDLPNTVFTTAHAGVQFMPSNYFDIDQSRRTVNAVRINYADGAATAVDTFGQKDATCAVDFTPVEYDLWGYKGDVVVRKFPYDPNNPYYETDSIV
ncbi:Uu.00g086690.m01.CDS01 [Anthostomella pinea]|uniref:Amine oxidase n=1 Tax=Anthostomella pinea TaxID=933095 RepID=A0AAI8VM98_9PEZI|nr:Uu.00g086690.m01.CDS01 [Anthostomella pinea]